MFCMTMVSSRDVSSSTSRVVPTELGQAKIFQILLPKAIFDS